MCKGPRHFASALTSDWNFSWSATVDRPPVFTIWASGPECSNYDEAGRSIVSETLDHAQTFISVDPRTTNLGKESDIHLAVKGGTDAALALALCDVVIKNDLVDWKFVKRWTNACFLVVDDKEPNGPEEPYIWHGPNAIKTTLLTQADLQEDGSPYKYMVWDNASQSLKWFNASARAPWPTPPTTRPPTRSATPGRARSRGCATTAAGNADDWSDAAPLPVNGAEATVRRAALPAVLGCPSMEDFEAHRARRLRARSR